MEILIGSGIMFWGIIMGWAMSNAQRKHEKHKVDIVIHDKPKSEVV